MFIAQELRKSNIAEYLLYMWQVENIIRAFDCSLSRIRKEYIERFDYDEEQKEELTDWYGNLIRMMNQEGCREQGHLQLALRRDDAALAEEGDYRQYRSCHQGDYDLHWHALRLL